MFFLFSILRSHGVFDCAKNVIFLLSFRRTIFCTEITKNGYTRSSNNHFRVQRKSSTRTPPGRPLIGRTTVVPGSGSKQSGCTRCAELMFRSTRYWLTLYPELVRSVQATRRRAHTPTRARVHTRISELTHDQPLGYGSPPHVKYSDILEHTTNPQDTDLRVHTRPTIRIRISATVKYSDILLKYSNNAAHFAARRILCENAPYVYQHSGGTFSQQPEITNEPAIT